ncbi:C39 family peptidase [Simiduia sp. 21SJ11W-1]|uniref:C39 family peptidase n=1 Tax=Simiduia sp. 21SJ11W-1 TaxID=2909669 RepID=UPI0020A11E6C|nr:C39 family peptidase [Simiduia sp. 21SJ11W-1]UTA48374.1 C39 family peptidase [Simiduia sp. 21SJ11W-1]
MQLHFSKALATGILAGFLLSACGGGGGGGSDEGGQPATETPAPTPSPTATPTPTPTPTPTETPKNFTVSTNKFGVWLWYIDQNNEGQTHASLAQQLSEQGVKRIFIKIADDVRNCDLFFDVCDATVSQTYRNAGVEPWTWSYNYPGDESAQAEALYLSAQYGYAGHVLDIESEFNGLSTELTALLEAFRARLDDAIADNHADANYLLGATTWGNPIDHGMRVDIIDDYVDFHMPQTYLENWGASYMADPAYWIEFGNCEYRDLGAEKPIWHIVSTEHGDITPEQIDTFLTYAGPNASIWRIPGGGVADSIYDDWAALNWERAEFAETPCGTGNNIVHETQVSTTPPAAVPHYSQLENANEPDATCSITSLAMITDYYGITDPDVLGMRTPDYLYDEYGLLQDVPSLMAGFDELAMNAGSDLRDHGTETGTLQQLRELARAGQPTIVHGWFTSSGHILVVTGFDGNYYTVQDPNGKWNLQKWGSYDTSVSGESQRYPKAAFEYAINDNGTGDDLWLHVFQ